ncbi:MAG: ACP S-malonyltransferase [Bacteroidales bacterium]|nr:ACP S-malonyltransferase [Bacteroidales bacterium]
MLKAYVFPGQGSQFPGMGKELYESSSRAKSLFEQADEILGFPISEIMMGDSAEELKATRVTQPAVFIHSVICASCSDIPAPDMVGGHSLGEFSALTAAQAMSFEDGLRLVAIRANEMQKCCEAHPGTMAAIIGLDTAKVEEICSQISEGIVVPANYNSEGQVVISGDEAAVQKACVIFKEAGARRALPLNVSGAFHSPLMLDAQDALARAISETPFKRPVCPVYQNVSAKAETDPEVIKENLLRQLTSPVRWAQSVRNMLADGAREFTEIGPGSVLQGLVKRIAAESGAEVQINGIQ